MAHTHEHDPQRTHKLLQAILTAHESHIGCDECVERMDCLAEVVVAGRHPEGILEAILNHIDCCHCCKSEFEALVSILRMERQTEQSG